MKPSFTPEMSQSRKTRDETGFSSQSEDSERRPISSRTEHHPHSSDKGRYHPPSEASSLKHTSSFRYEPIVSTIPLHQVSADQTRTRKPNHRQQISQFGLDNSECLGNSTHTMRHSRNVLTKESYKNQQVPDNYNNFFSSSLTTTRDLKLGRAGNTARCPPDSRRSRPKESSSFNTSSNMVNALASPTKCLDSFLVTSCRSMSLSPVSSHRKATHFQAKNRSNRLRFKNIAPDFISELPSGQTGSRLETARSNHFVASRDIFSPINSELLGDEGHRGRNTPGPQHLHGRNEDVVSISEEGCLFPAIKIEDCDEGPDEFPMPTRSPDSPSYICEIKRSATMPTDAFYNIINADRGGVRPNMTSLDVPSPYVEWRTSEGRIMAAVSDSRSAGSLSRTWSHSEGNIPMSLRDYHEQTSEDTPTNNTDKTQTSHLLSQHFNHPSLNPRLSPRVPAVDSKERDLLTPTLHAELSTRSVARQTRVAHVADTRRNTPFVSPQPQRKLEPKF